MYLSANYTKKELYSANIFILFVVGQPESIIFIMMKKSIFAN